MSVQLVWNPPKPRSGSPYQPGTINTHGKIYLYHKNGKAIYLTPHEYSAPGIRQGQAQVIAYTKANPQPKRAPRVRQNPFTQALQEYQSRVKAGTAPKGPYPTKPGFKGGTAAASTALLALASPIVDEVGSAIGWRLGVAIKGAFKPKPAAKPKPVGTGRANNTVPTTALTGRYIPGSQQVAFKLPEPIATEAAKLNLPPAVQQSLAKYHLPGDGVVGPLIRPSTPTRPALPGVPASESYRDGGRGLYQGSNAYRASVSGSGNPLLDSLRIGLGRNPKTGEKVYV